MEELLAQQSVESKNNTKNSESKTRRQSGEECSEPCCITASWGGGVRSLVAIGKEFCIHNKTVQQVSQLCLDELPSFTKETAKNSPRWYTLVVYWNILIRGNSPLPFSVQWFEISLAFVCGLLDSLQQWENNSLVCTKNISLMVASFCLLCIGVLAWHLDIARIFFE